MTPYRLAVERFPRLRQSRLATFDRCALSAKFEDDYREGWSGHPQARGTIFHRFAAKALREMHVMGSNTIPTDTAVSILEECLRQADIDKVCPTCPKPVVKRYTRREDSALRVICEAGHDHASDFVNLPMEQIKDLRWIVVKWANEAAFDIENLVDVEQRLVATITYPDGRGGHVERELTGQLDAVFVSGAQDDHAIVLDWKDTWSLPSPSEVGFDGYFQQRMYAWLIFRNYPSIQRVTLREFYVRRSESREATVYRADIEDVEADLSALVERYDKAFHEEMFPPSPGAHCHFCPRPTQCPIFPDVRRDGSITDPKMARRFAAEAIVAKSALDQRTEALKAWASVHGAVEISDHKGRRVWGHRERKRVGRPDKDKLHERLMQTGGRLTPQDLNELYQENKTTRFEPHIPQPVEDSPDDAALMNALEQSLKELP